MHPQEGVAVALVLIGSWMPLVIIGIFYYLKKRLEHKRIMGAIEKGIPLSQLRKARPAPRGDEWIRSLSRGAAMIIAGFGFIVFHGITLLVGFLLFALGVYLVTGSYLRRKYVPAGHTPAPGAGVHTEMPE
jgi:hypothetical protein